ncbi:hypothetical protein NBRC116493_25940 [Aurantivibrio infirmus]
MVKLKLLQVTIEIFRSGVRSAIRPLIIFSIFLFAPLVNAQFDEPQVDVRFVIDMSGSMRQNDPNNLRQPALELLVKLLPENSKSGVWTFGKYVNMLVPHKDVSEEWRASAAEASSRIKSNGLYTNMGEALEKAAYDLESKIKSRRDIILLTDGMVDISREPEENLAEWRRIVDEVLPSLKEAGFRIHTIALSEKADVELLNKLSVSTDGVSAVANTADELVKIFVEALDSAAPAEQLPFEGNSFIVDSSVEEFTALIFANDSGEAIKLASPDGSIYEYEKPSDDVSWFHGDSYELITVTRPLEGEWGVSVDVASGSKISIVSNLSLVVKAMKNNIAVGDALTLSALLREDNKTIARDEFLDLLELTYLVERITDGERWEGKLEPAAPNSGLAKGIFHTPLTMFDTAGSYRIRVNVDGKTFQREFTHQLTAHEAFSTSVTKSIRGSQTRHLISLRTYRDDIDLNNTKVKVRIIDPNEKSVSEELILSQVDSWEREVIPRIDGTYQVYFDVDAQDVAGKRFSVTSNVIRITHPDGDDPFAAENSKQDDVQDEKPAPVPTQIAPDENAAPEQAMEEEGTEESGTLGKVWLYGGIALANIFMLGLAFFAYRMIMGKKEEEILEEVLTEQGAGAPTELVELDPSLADLASDQDGAAEKESTREKESDDEKEASALSDEEELALLAAELDIASDAEENTDVDSNAEENEQSSTAEVAAEVNPGEDLSESETGGEEKNEPAEFSIDDFQAEDDTVDLPKDVTEPESETGEEIATKAEDAQEDSAIDPEATSDEQATNSELNQEVNDEASEDSEKKSD